MVNILCFGDSNTYGYIPVTGERYGTDIRWPMVMKSILGDDYNVIEEGCSGRTTIYDDPKDGWKSGISYVAACLHSHRPIDIIVLMLGSNDMKVFFGVTKETIGVGVTKIIEEIRAYFKGRNLDCPKILLAAPPVLGAGMDSSPFFGDFNMDSVELSKSFSESYKEVAKNLDCAFIDTAAFVDSCPEDCVHLTPEAHKVLAGEFAKAIRAI